MDDEIEWEQEEDGIPYRRFMKADLAVLGLGLVAGIVGAVHETLSAAQTLAAYHANYINSRHDFHEEAALEIETLTSGEIDG